MRPLVLSLALLVSLSARAVELRFYTDHPDITPATSASTFVQNEGDDPAFDIVIELTLSERLTLRNVSTVPDMECTRTDRTATCRQGRLDPGELIGFFFEVNATDFEGGRHSATATMRAKNVDPQTVLFNVTSGRSYVVTTDADFGAGSLRAAIEDLNENPLCGSEVSCTITFIDSRTIKPATPLPPIRKCNVFISGFDFWELPMPVKSVMISGENATHGNGFEIRAACAEGVRGVTLQGMAIGSWPGDGVYVSTPAAHQDRWASHSISRCYIGTDVTGLVAKPNGGRGVVTDSPHDVIGVGSSIVSANARSGIALYGAKQAYIHARIGVDRDNNPMGNGASGVFTWGTPVDIGHSTIAHNAHYGIAVAAGTPKVTTSWLTVHSNGGLPIDWGLDGRTLPDDETDGIPNAPRITNIVWDAVSSRAIISGTLRMRRGAIDRARLALYRAASPRGDVLGPIPYTQVQVDAPAEGVADVPFEIIVQGDFLGSLVAVQAVAVGTDGTASELSEGVEIK